jgi:hypothetical protein
MTKIILTACRAITSKDKTYIPASDKNYNEKNSTFADRVAILVKTGSNQ